MATGKVYMRFVFAGVASVVFTCICVNASFAADDSALSNELTEACVAAKANFRAIVPQEVAKRKAELSGAVECLSKRLAKAGPNGEAWGKFVQIETLRKELAKETPDLDAINASYQKFLAGHEGLGLVWFLDVRSALLRYVEVRRGLENAQLKAEYEQLVDKLSEQLAGYAAKPSPERAVAIGHMMRWLEDNGQAPQALQAIHGKLLKPNLLVDVSAAFVAAGMDSAIDETEPLCDCILRTSLQGTTHTTGARRAVLQPCGNNAVLDTVFQGIAASETVGVNGPVCIHSHSTTTLAGCKRVWINADGLFTHPATSDAHTCTTITDIQARNGSPLIERIAWKRAGKQKPRAEQIASMHAEARLNERMDAEGAKTLADSNKQFEEQFRKPLTEHKMFPQSLDFSSTAEALQIVCLQAGAAQIAASNPSPQPVAGGADLVVRVHESMINNAASSMLSGMIVHDETFRERMTKILGELPDRLKPEPDQEPLAVGFAPDMPITVTFADGGYTVVIRGQKFFKSEEVYPGMDVTAKYKIEKSDKGFKLVRQGPLEINPPGFAADSGKKLSAKQIVIRKLLDRRFGKVLEEQAEIEEIALPGNWAKAGKLKPIEMISRDGWLVTTWKLAAAK